MSRIMPSRRQPLGAQRLRARARSLWFAKTRDRASGERLMVLGGVLRAADASNPNSRKTRVSSPPASARKASYVATTTCVSFANAAPREYKVAESQASLRHLRWLMQKEQLGQDVFLTGPAGTRAGEERRQKHNAGHEAWAADPAARELTKLIRLCRTPRSLCVLVGARSSHMDYIHVATAFHRLATLIKAGTGAGRQGSRAKRAAKPEVVQWADEHADALALLTGRAVALMDGFQARAVSNVWWACATMAKHAGAPLAPALRDALMRRSLATMDDFAPQTLANTLWSMASLRVAPTPELLEAMALRAPAIAHDFQPQVLRHRTLPPPCCCPDLGLASNRWHSPSELPLTRIPTATAGVPAGPFAECMHSYTKATRML